MNDVVVMVERNFGDQRLQDRSDLQWEFTSLDPLLIQVKMPFIDEVLKGFEKNYDGIGIGLKQRSGLRD